MEQRLRPGSDETMQVNDSLLAITAPVVSRDNPPMLPPVPSRLLSFVVAHGSGDQGSARRGLITDQPLQPGSFAQVVRPLKVIRARV